MNFIFFGTISNHYCCSCARFGTGHHDVQADIKSQQAVTSEIDRYCAAVSQFSGGGCA